MTTTSLTGRRIIVTGGASGMGEGLVRAFPKLGAQLVSLDFSEAAGEVIAREAGAHFVKINVADKASVDAAFAAAVEHLGGLDVLIHAAGIAPAAKAEETGVELWHKVNDVNALGTLLTNQAAFEYMKDNGGQIINFASAAGIEGYPNKIAYAASKGAVVALTRTLAVEWAKHGITANMVAPTIWTPMYDKTRSEMSPEVLAMHDAQVAKQIPLGGKLGSIEQDFVPVMAFYASKGAKYLTGQVISISGGSLMLR